LVAALVVACCPLWRSGGGTAIIRSMGTLKAQVRNGRLVLDEPTSLPEGAVVEFTIADDDDDLDDEERAALHEALGRSWRSAAAGDTKPVEEILRVLRTRN